MRHKQMKREVKINGGCFLLLCMIITTGVYVTALAEPGDDVETILLEDSSVDVVIDTSHLSKSKEPLSQDSVQSISFMKDMSIKDALRFLAAKYRKNIIPSSQVSGKLNVTNLYEVTFEEALNAILGHDYRYEIDGNFIRIYTAEEYAKFMEDETRMTSRVFELYYVNAAEIKALITPILSESGEIASTTAASVDTEAGQGGDTATIRDTIVVFDFPERLNEIEKMIREIDVKPQQILVEVTVLKATLTETTEFGIEWDNIGGLNLSHYDHQISVGLPSGISAGAGLTVGFTHNWIVAHLTALETISDVTVLANPKIMALNKQAGHINIGSETGYTESTTQSSTGTTTSVAFLESGTLLKFRPFICDNGYIRMEINPEESTASTSTSDDGAIVIPSKTITQVKTNIMVKDGRTIIIGGLFKEDLTNTDGQVPILGDLPVVGPIFKRTKNTNVRSELVILITPHLIEDPEELTQASSQRENDIDVIVDGSRKRLSSVSRMRIYEDKYAKAVKYYADKEYNKALVELDWIIAYRPNTVEAVQLRDRILAKIRPDEYRRQDRIMLDNARKNQDVMWKRK
ncbi:MAG: hypothetical protein JW806_08020 [Sedimentisphaerales bacterium]|nr:hypothetical protein [Sedimentisphaerales bacterium]